MSGLVENPEQMAEMRQRIFELKKDVVLSSDDFSTYWLYVDNLRMTRNVESWAKKGL
ncbi:MAG: hypothetical protein M1835_001384, partial [Candelina submexicana]